jgi:uncharacterized protein (DUF952 family)
MEGIFEKSAVKNGQIHNEYRYSIINNKILFPMILHITNRQDWELANQIGEYIPASLKSDGFIHCSTLKQTVDTANLFFKGQTGLVLLCIDENKLTAVCKYEDPAGKGPVKHDPRPDNHFPHIYGPINLASVVKVVDFPANVNGYFELPDEIK